MIFSQIFDMINLGLVVLDRDLKVCHWNRWMVLHSGVSKEQIVGSSIFDRFPRLNNARFLRNCKSVLSFGNLCFLSQKLHHHLFPIKPDSSFASGYDYMQQSCTMGPLRDESGAVKYIFITVQDVTEVVAYEQKLVEMNMKDGLTGVYNRRFLECQLRDECERSKRYGRPLSLIFLDIDRFKRLNDGYGHPCGDLVLKTLSATIAARLRKTDFFARYGGEEFCCLLPETDMDAAMALAEKLRTMVAALKIAWGEAVISVTISFGVAATAPGADEPAALVKRADDALYRAKQTGRDKVVASAA